MFVGEKIKLCFFQEYKSLYLKVNLQKFLLMGFFIMIGMSYFIFQVTEIEAGGKKEERKKIMN